MPLGLRQVKYPESNLKLGFVCCLLIIIHSSRQGIVNLTYGQGKQKIPEMKEIRMPEGLDMPGRGAGYAFMHLRYGHDRAKIPSR